MEDAGYVFGRICFGCMWERRRNTGMDAMGLKEWEQESQRRKVGGGGLAKGSVGAEFPRGCCSASHYEVRSNGHRVESNTLALQSQ